MLNLSHKKLDVWKFSLEMVVKIYSLTKMFPKEELFGLSSQLKRASVSVTSNIAEGLSRISTNEKFRFLEIARSSLVEIDTQIEISIKLNYCDKEDIKEIDQLMNSVFAMITSLMKKIDNKI
ncbi:MAG: four helix bundle protein [Melioribacteraceae bacterium]|jgi:four helix bundle protein|nr:four helix bundle protein [Melioribacteraceae bacterium]